MSGEYENFIEVAAPRYRKARRYFLYSFAFALLCGGVSFAETTYDFLPENLDWYAEVGAPALGGALFLLGVGNLYFKLSAFNKADAANNTANPGFNLGGLL